MLMPFCSFCFAAAAKAVFPLCLKKVEDNRLKEGGSSLESLTVTVALDYSSFVMKEEGEGAQFGLFAPQPTRGCKLEILGRKRFHICLLNIFKVLKYK